MSPVKRVLFLRILLTTLIGLAGPSCKAPVVRESAKLESMIGYILQQTFIHPAMRIQLRFPDKSRFFSNQLTKTDELLAGAYFHSTKEADEDYPFSRHYFSTKIELPESYNGTMYLVSQQPDVSVTQKMVESAMTSKLAAFVSVLTGTPEEKVKPHLKVEHTVVRGRKVSRMVADVVGPKGGAVATAFYGIWTDTHFLILQSVAFIPPALANGDKASALAQARLLGMEKIAFGLSNY